MRLLTDSETSTFIKKYISEVQEITNFSSRVYLPLRKGKNWEDLMPELEKVVSKDNTRYSKKDMEIILLSLYSIRNSLFHGKKQIIATQDQILKHAYNILLPLLALMLVKYLICYHSDGVPDDSCPRQT